MTDTVRLPLPQIQTTATNPLPHPAECIYSKSWLHPSLTEPPPRPVSTTTPSEPNTNTGPGRPDRRSRAARAGDDAKLIFGTVFSLRNMVRKLGGEDDAFISYRTGQYKLHYYETASSVRFVMLTDTAAPSMRNVLHQIYINLWVEYGAYLGQPPPPFLPPRGGDGC